MKSRDEYLIWEKQCALVNVDRGDVARAVKGLRASPALGHNRTLTLNPVELSFAA